MPSELLYLQEHLSCRHYISDYRCGFVHRDIRKEDLVYLEKEYNHLIFLLEGEMIVSLDEFPSRCFMAGDIFFIPLSAHTKFVVTKDSKLVVFTFDRIKSVCDKFNLHSCWSVCKYMKYDFLPIKIIPQMKIFLEQAAYYYDQGVKCEHYHEIKMQEMFLILRWFYTKEQIAQLFYPIIGQSIDFRVFVLNNHLKVKTSHELASLSMMGRSSFDTKFKEEFGIPPGQWLLKQKAKHIKAHLATPGVTISDILIKFDFTSASHFSRFCKQQFGYSPAKMMAKLKTEETKTNTDSLA